MVDMDKWIMEYEYGETKKDGDGDVE